MKKKKLILVVSLIAILGVAGIVFIYLNSTSDIPSDTDDDSQKGTDHDLQNDNGHDLQNDGDCDIDAIEDPAFSMPIKPEDYETVSGIQRWDPTFHVGFDFTLRVDTEIIAPSGGVVKDILIFPMENDLWIVTVTVEINCKWAWFIAFEPCTYEESVAEAQLSNISAYIQVGDTIQENQTLGWLLPISDSEFPHIHWSVLENREYVNPVEYMAPWAEEIIAGYCAEFYDHSPCF